MVNIAFASQNHLTIFISNKYINGNIISINTYAVKHKNKILEWIVCSVPRKLLDDILKSNSRASIMRI